MLARTFSFHVDLYGKNVKRIDKKIEKLLRKPSLAKRVNITSAKWRKEMRRKGLSRRELRDAINKKNEEFRFVLQFLQKADYAHVVPDSIVGKDGAVDIVKNYARASLDSSLGGDPRKHELWAWKHFLSKDGSVRNLSVPINMPAPEGRVYIDMTKFGKEELVEYFYPAILKLVGNRRNELDPCLFDDASKIMTPFDYRVGVA